MQELFDKQSEDYKSKILDKDPLIVSIEAEVLVVGTNILEILTWLLE